VDRREFSQIVAAGAAGAVLANCVAAEAQVARAVRGLPSPIIEDIKVITTEPREAHLLVIKVLTDQDGLYGYGCGSFNRRAPLVVPAVEEFLKPLLIGKPADRIEDTWADGPALSVLVEDEVEGATR